MFGCIWTSVFYWSRAVIRNFNNKCDSIFSCNHYFLISLYSSTCHRWPPPVLSKSVPSWQVVPRDRERTLCAIMSNQKHTSDGIHSTAHAQQYKAQNSMTILNAVRHETNTAENVWKSNSIYSQGNAYMWTHTCAVLYAVCRVPVWHTKSTSAGRTRAWWFALQWQPAWHSASPLCSPVK